MAKISIFFIRLYRRYISPIIPPRCPYCPTCSTYALEAFSRHGFFKGIALSGWRVLRCNPFTKGGYDPVPLNKGTNTYETLK